MKIKSIIKIIIFFAIFVACLGVVLSGGYSHENVFPQKMNVFIEGRNPLDFPAKLVNSDVMKAYFASENGKKTKAEVEEAINGIIDEILAPKKDKEPAPLYFEKYKGIRIYMPSMPEPGDNVDEEDENTTTPESTEPEGTEDLKTKDKIKTKAAKALKLESLIDNILTTAPAAAKEYHIALYGDPMSNSEKKEGFLISLDIGKRALIPKVLLPAIAISLPEDAKAKAKAMGTVKVAFTVLGNLIVAGSPNDVKIAIDIQTGRKPALKDSIEWKRYKSELKKDSDLSVVIMPQNIIGSLDPDTAMILSMSFPMANELDGVIIQMKFGPEGFSSDVKLKAKEGSKVIDILDQNVKGDRSLASLAPKGFGGVSSIKIDSILESWKKLNETFKDMEMAQDIFLEWQDDVKARFDIGMEEYAGLLKNELVSVSHPSEGMMVSVACAETQGGAAEALMRTTPIATTETQLVDIPQTVGSHKIMISKGENPVAYTQIGHFICYGEEFSALEGYLNIEKIDPTASNKMKDVLKELPKDPELLMLMDGLVMAKHSPFMTISDETLAILGKFNNYAGVAFKVDKNGGELKYYSALNLFNGSTESSGRSKVNALLIAANILVYVVGLIALLLLISNVRKSMKSEE